MCNAYELGKRGGSFPDLVRADSARELLGITATRLIRRTDPAPVVTADGALRTMRWGFARHQANAINNARADKLSGAMWSDSFRHRRCLIPVAAFYEWSGPTGHKRTHRFTRPDGGWLWMAGLWEESRDFGPCFSMITTEANTLVAPIHERMPAVLDDDQLSPWLGGNISTFAPPDTLLQVADAVNPLTKKPWQGELF